MAAESVELVGVVVDESVVAMGGGLRESWWALTSGSRVRVLRNLSR